MTRHLVRWWVGCTVAAAPLAECTPASGAPGGAAGPQRSWVEETYGDFVSGTFDDGGAQLYATAAGDIRFINQYDFNADGAVDLVFCNTHDTVEKPDALIYLGKDGDYSSQRVTPVATDGAYYSLVEDLDRDGWPELVVINRDNGISTVLQSFVYWGGADGYAHTRRSEIQTFNPGRCVAADLNGDGLKDLIVPNGAYRRGAVRRDDVGVRVHWGSPNGYGDYDVQRIGLDEVTCVAVGLLGPEGSSGARRPDLFVGRNKGPSFILRNGEQGLDSNTPIALDCGRVVQALVIDFNGDGRDDLLINGGPGSPLYLFPAGASGVSAAGRRDLGVVGGRAIACADLDKDEVLDLVVAGSSAERSVIYWGGIGGYSASRVTAIDTTGASDVCIADLDQDGSPDVVLAQEMNDETFDLDSLILWGAGTRSIGARVTRLPGRGTVGVSVGDVNRDGQLDVVLTGRIGGTRAGRVPTFIYWNDGRGGFSSRQRTGLVTNDNYEAAAADLNLDGYTDLVFAEQYETQGEVGASHIFWGGRDGFRQDSSTGLRIRKAMGVSVADLNRDGWLDLVFGAAGRDADGHDTSPIFFGGPDGFSAASKVELRTTGPGTPTIADFNRDGWLDVIFPNGIDNTGAWLYWGGAEGFDSGRCQRVCLERGFKCEAVDLNADGWLDLVFVIRVKGVTKDTYSLVYLGGPDGFSEKRRLELPTRGAGAASVADLNRDGWLDVFITNYASDATRRLPAYVYWGGETGWAALNRTELPAESGSGNLIADFNADGWLDIAIACHRLEGSRDLPGHPNTHVARSYVYWGSPAGFDIRRRLELPTLGPHGMLGVDPGHVYHRRPEWVYVSSVQTLDRTSAVRAVDWRGQTPEGTSLALQVRLAASEAALQEAEWCGPSGPATWFTNGNTSAQRQYEALRGRYAQYRVRFRSARCARYPALERVEIGLQ